MPGFKALFSQDDDTPRAKEVLPPSLSWDHPGGCDGALLSLQDEGDSCQEENMISQQEVQYL